jgi:hypothetical protein
MLRIVYYLMIIFCLGTKERTRKEMERDLEMKETSKDVRIKLEARARVRLGVQEQAALKRTPRSHTGSVWDVLHMHGKLRRRPIQWF